MKIELAPGGRWHSPTDPAVILLAGDIVGIGFDRDGKPVVRNLTAERRDSIDQAVRMVLDQGGYYRQLATVAAGRGEVGAYLANEILETWRAIAAWRAMRRA
jgi:hypothetical protein